MRYLLAVVILCCSSVVSAADPSKVKSFGVYLNQDSDYVRIKSFKGWDVFYRHFKDIPVAKTEGKPLELLIYQKDLDTSRMEFIAHPYEVLARNNRLTPIVTPVDGKKEMYKISFEEKVDRASLLEVQLYWGASFRGMVTLSDPKPQLLRIFSKEDQNAVGVVDSMKDILKAYPGDKDFEKLAARWEVIAKAQKDDSDYKYVIDAWAKYKQMKKPGSKLQWLKRTQREINGYKNAHPKGKHIKEAEELEKIIKQKLEL